MRADTALHHRLNSDQHELVGCITTCTDLVLRNRLKLHNVSDGAVHSV